MRFVAIVVLILGLVTLNSGLNLMGSPLSFANLTRGMFTAAASDLQPAGGFLQRGGCPSADRGQ